MTKTASTAGSVNARTVIIITEITERAKRAVQPATAEHMFYVA